MIIVHIMNKYLLPVIFLCLGLNACKTAPPPVSKLEPSSINDFHSATRDYLKGDYESAHKTLIQLIQKTPNHSAAYYLLAKINLVQKNYPDLMNNLALATKYDPTNEYYASELAFIYSQAGDYKKAASLFLSLVNKENPNPIHYFGAYENLVKAKLYAKALEVIELQEKKFGPNPSTVIQRFNTLIAMGREKAAESFLTEICATYPNDPLFLSTLIDFYLDKGSDQKAFPLLKTLCETDPDNGMAKWLYGQFLLNTTDSLMAFTYLKEAVALEGPTIEQKAELLLSLQKNYGCTKATQKITESFVQANPNEVIGLTLLGDLYIQCNEVKKAQSAYSEALELNPNAYPVWEQSLYLLFTLGDWQALNVESEKCKELFPMQPFPYLTAGIAKNNIGNFQLAIQDLKAGQNYLSVKSTLKTEFLFQTGVANAALGNQSDAVGYFNKAFANDPLNIHLKVDALVEIIDKGEFNSFCDSILTDCKKLGINHFKLTAIACRQLFVTQQYEKALTCLSNTIKDGCNWYLAYRWLGDCHEKLGNRNSAQLFWEKANELEQIEIGKSKILTPPK